MMMRSDIELPGNSEALLTVGQIILHYQYNRLEGDTYSDWCIGMAISGRTPGVVKIEEDKQGFLAGSEARFLRNWKVDSRSTGSIIIEKLLEKGFSQDRMINNVECCFQPPGGYHVFVYRKTSSE